MALSHLSLSEEAEKAVRSMIADLDDRRDLRKVISVLFFGILCKIG